MRKIIVYCEVENGRLTDTSYELISKAFELKAEAKKLITKNNDFLVEAVVLAGIIDKDDVNKAYSAGCDKFVHIKDFALNLFVQTAYAEAFIEYFNQNSAEIIIFPATPTGRIVAPRITTRLNTGLIADCTNLEFVAKNDVLKLAPTRPTFGAELMATILCKTLPQCATIRPGVFKANFSYGSKGEFLEYNLRYSFDESRFNVLSSVIEKSKMCDFGDAKIILAAGFGLASDRSSFEKLKKIAKITGAKFAASRKVVDLGYVEREYQIGQTGATAEADIYIAFGISGAIQHVSGMKNCKKIISINTDENADIFKYSDCKIVDDATRVIADIYDKLTS